MNPESQRRRALRLLAALFFALAGLLSPVAATLAVEGEAEALETTVGTPVTTATRRRTAVRRLRARLGAATRQHERRPGPQPRRRDVSVPVPPAMRGEPHPRRGPPVLTAA